MVEIKDPLQTVRHYQPTYATRIENFITYYFSKPFGGRDEELAMPERWRTEGAEQRLLLAAPAGRGKSALLVHWQYQLAHNDDVAVVF